MISKREAGNPTEESMRETAVCDIDNLSYGLLGRTSTQVVKTTNFSVFSGLQTIHCAVVYSRNNVKYHTYFGMLKIHTNLVLTIPLKLDVE